MENTQNEPVKRRGRPPRAETQEAAPVKKGKPTWRPANVDETIKKEDGYRYRWINDDESNVEKKKLEQWEVVSGVSSPQTQSEAGYGRINDGKPMTSVRKRQGQILARIPEEVGQQRDAFVNAKTERFTAGLAAEAKKDLKGAPVHGSIEIKKRGTTTVIE